MKFMKFGKALLISALSVGVVLGVTSCIQSYSVGYIYVTGTVTGETNSNGIVSGYKIEHNTGKLTKINGLPVSSGGANPVRAVLAVGSNFLYVLNRGVNANGTADCSGTSGATVCNGSNIEAFAVGGNGILTPQGTYYTQGFNPIRMVLDNSGNYLMVLDQDAPASSGCAAVLGSSVTSCGDITVFKIDTTTGRLSLITNTQGTTTLGSTLTYFPVPAHPIDFILSSSVVLTLSGTSSTGDSTFPYAYSSSNGQLTLTQNSSQSLNLKKATGMVVAGGYIYIMDNEPPAGNSAAFSMIIPYTLSSTGSLQAESAGQIAIDSTLSNPSYMMIESKSQYIYVANQGQQTTGTNNPDSGISAFQVTTSPALKLTPTTPSAFGSGSGPQCIVEDPSNQYIFTANYYDSTITGRVLDQNAGLLNAMRSTSSYTLTGKPTWCLINGRTN